MATVLVPVQAGAQHSRSPIKAEDGAMILLNGSTAQKFPRPLPAMSLLPGMVANLDVRSRPRCVITGGFVDFVRAHLAGDIAHLLADVVPAYAGSKSLELSFDVRG
jgi:hypothetical protein